MKSILSNQHLNLDKEMIHRLKYILRRGFSNGSIGVESQITEHSCKNPRAKQGIIRKSISVAIIGNANAGKSTLINTMMGLNICAASKKPHTTQEYQRVFQVEGDTQIIILDTPGILSLRGRKKFQLKASADVFLIDSIKTVDLVGVLVDVSCKYNRSSLGSEVIRLLSEFPKGTKRVLLLNKVDLLKDKFKLLELVDKYSNEFIKYKNNVEKIRNANTFSRIFMISALQNDGVKAFVDYICSVASNILESTPVHKLSDHSDAKIVEQRVKAALLQHLPFEVPYLCSSQVELIHENALGKINIAVLIKCTTVRHHKIVNRHDTITLIKEECEKDLMQYFGKPVNLVLEGTLYKK